MKKILIIEDDFYIRELLARELIKENYEVIQVVGGEEGLKKIKEENIDLVLLDLILPGIQGYEVLSKIKEDVDTSAIPVIIISNLGQKEEVEKGLKLGAIDFLIKAHFAPDEIIDKIKAVLK